MNLYITSFISYFYFDFYIYYIIFGSKNLMEQQFDSNMKFKDAINQLDVKEMRFLSIGRDNQGFSYWHLMVSI